MNDFVQALRKNPWERLLAVTLPLCLLFSMVSISLLQIFLSLSIVLWAVKLWRDRERFAAPSFFIPLLVYAALSILSSAFSVSPEISFRDSRELLLFLMIPLIYTAFSRIEDLDLTHWAVLGSGLISACYSLIYYFFKALPGERIRGFMGHYMTQAGILLLFGSMALALVSFGRRKGRWLWGIALLLALFSLALTLTRSAWIGLFIVICFFLLLWKPVSLLLVPILAGLVFLVSPQPLKKRALSVFNLDFYSNRQRLEYFRAGIKIIGEHPFLGTGPDTVDIVFQHPRYNLSEAARRNVHLHDNFLQIAAERGIPTLLAWMVFLVWTFLNLLGLLKNKEPGVFPFAAGGMAALLALVTAGFFEYNFGDSEITTLFLYLIVLPFTYLRLRGKEVPVS